MKFDFEAEAMYFSDEELRVLGDDIVRLDGVSFADASTVADEVCDYMMEIDDLTLALSERPFRRFAAVVMDDYLEALGHNKQILLGMFGKICILEDYHTLLQTDASDLFAIKGDGLEI